MALVRLVGDAQRSIDKVLTRSLDEFGEDAAARYAALIRQAIVDFARDPSAPTVRLIGRPRNGRVLLRYDLVLSRDNIPVSIGRVVKPRHFIVGRLDDGLLRVLFIAHDRMKPENVPRRSRRSDSMDN